MKRAPTVSATTMLPKPAAASTKKLTSTSADNASTPTTQTRATVSLPSSGRAQLKNSSFSWRQK